MLRRYRLAVGSVGGARLVALAAIVSLGYFTVWALAGIGVFLIGEAAAALESSNAAAIVIAIGIAMQFSSWKAHHLARCREASGPGQTLAGDAGTASRHGLRLGVHCVCSCANLTAILLAVGVMNVIAMVAVTVAITAERLAPEGAWLTSAIRPVRPRGTGC
jgi:predicted metal-binding membrane protein